MNEHVAVVECDGETWIRGKLNAAGRKLKNGTKLYPESTLAAANERIRELEDKVERLATAHACKEWDLILEREVSDRLRDALKVSADEIERLRAENADTQRILAESQARERVKNDALRIADKFIDRHSESWYLSGQEDLATVRAATAIPSDSTALDAVIAKAKREALLGAEQRINQMAGEDAFYSSAVMTVSDATKELRRMADELKGGEQ